MKNPRVLISGPLFGNEYFCRMKRLMMSRNGRC